MGTGDENDAERLRNLLAELWRDYGRQLLAHALARSGGALNAARALTQDAALRVLVAHPECDTIESLLGYHLRAIDSAAMDRARKSAKVLLVDGDTLAEIGDHAGLQPSPEQLAIAGETARALEQAIHEARELIEQLPAGERAVIELRYLFRSVIGWREVAKELGISEGAARTRHSRAIQRLRKLAGPGKEEGRRPAAPTTETDG